MYVMWIDPGTVSGVAVYEDTMPVGSVMSHRFTSYELGREELLSVVEKTAQRVTLRVSSGSEDKFVIGMEDYIITRSTAKKTQQRWPLEIIGAVRHISEKYYNEFVLQSPETRMFASDDKLKAVEWYKPTVGGHANDAARHLLRYLWAEKKLPLDLTNRINDTVTG